MMKAKFLQVEQKLYRKGFPIVIGLDEVGRGALAGPVVACAVVINPKFKTPNPKRCQSSKFKNSEHFDCLNFENLNLFRICNLEFGILRMMDSKKLSPKKREEFYKIFTQHPAIKWAVGKVSEKVIDKINILEATKLAMKKAVEKLRKKYQLPIAKSYLVLDGKIKLDLPIKQISIVKADEKVFSCAVASIIAKVIRDRLMIKYHQQYPQYGFYQHKGYGTKLHQMMIKKYKPCPIHRKTFQPLHDLL